MIATFRSKCFFTVLTIVHELIWEMLGFNMISNMSSSIMREHAANRTLEAIFTLTMPNIFRHKLEQITWVTDIIMS